MAAIKKKAVSPGKDAEKAKTVPPRKEVKPATKGKPCASKGCPVKKEAERKDEAKDGEEEGGRNDKVRRYHIAKHPNGGWSVKFAEGEKNIKIFKTQKEAHDYALQMVENQKGRGVKASVVVHSKKGKLRKMH